MKQSAYVKAVDEARKTATVKVKRESACAACEQRTFCFGCADTVTAEAKNDVGAHPGDTVTVETSTKNLMLYSILNFVLPVAAGIAVYIAVSPHFAEGQAVLYTLIAFFAVFFGMLLFSKIRSGRDLELHITAIDELGGQPEPRRGENG